jgi:hypothetical protein
VDHRVHDGLHPLKPLDPLRSEAAMFRVLVTVIVVAAVVVALVLLVRAVS